MKESSDHIGVIGLGYVGLPIALAFSSRYSVTGYDINTQKVATLQSGIDPSDEMPSSSIAEANLTFTAEQQDLAECNIYLIAVPTPVDENKVPDLSALKQACKSVGGLLKQGDLVIFESTVFPGCTDQVCIPILEKGSGLNLNKDFHVGYSPERINPGDHKRGITQVVKIVSGSDALALEKVAKLYGSIIIAGVHKVSSIAVAEAAKIMENTQRNINIALMNEMAMIFEKMGVNTREVIEAADTKWNFQAYYPGLVGGHCIDVDPYYLTHRAEALGYNPEMILAGKRINAEIPRFICRQIVQKLLDQGKVLSKCRVLIKGITYKENVKDHRNSKVMDLYKELRNFKLDVNVTDPLADPTEIKRIYDIDLSPTPSGSYDVCILAVAHQQYKNASWSEVHKTLREDAIIFDVKNISTQWPIPKSMQVLFL